MKREIDHIVYCVPDLEQAVENIQEMLGVKPIFGGKHLTEGTKNALVNLGNKCYLEILAIDQENKTVNGPRWMGIDFIDRPKITRWALKTSDPHKDAKTVRAYHKDMGQVKGGSRNLPSGKTLEWDLVMPLAEPEVEIIPFMTDWTRSEVHPTDALEEACTFTCLEFYHTEPEKVRPVLTELMDNFDLKKGDRNAIYLTIESPTGYVKIG